MAYLSICFVLLVLPTALSVIEQGRDESGNIMWKPGLYRNRDEVPIPTGYDLEKKHKREADEEDNDDSQDINARPSKKSFIRTHFSMPFGAELPLGYSEKVQRKGRKKSEVARVPLADKLIEDPRNEFKPLHVDETASNGASRSKVPKTWGLTWNDPYPAPEMMHDEAGSERSTLEGLNKEGKISEDEFDSGLMGRGLGGMRERAQNENLMEKEFAEKLSDESDVETETKNSRHTTPSPSCNNLKRIREVSKQLEADEGSKRFIFFLPHLHHYGHHPHHHHPHHHYPPPPPPNRPPPHPPHPPHPPYGFSPVVETNTKMENRSNETVSELTSEAKMQTVRPFYGKTQQNQNTPSNQNISLVYSNNTFLPDKANLTEGEARQFKQAEQSPIKGSTGGDTLSGNENNEYEYQPQYGNVPDGEYDKQFPFQPDGNYWQYANHDPHHNSFNPHPHNPYKMHQPHDDYKSIHPAHPFEKGMYQTVNNTWNPPVTNKWTTTQAPNATTTTTYKKKKEIPARLKEDTHRLTLSRRFSAIRDAIKHFLFNGGKIIGRHREEDLSPAEIIA